MGLIMTLLVSAGLAAVIVWIADWASVGGRHYRALDFSISALSAARSTRPNTKRNAN